MANMADCLQRAIDAGDLDATRGAEAISRYNKFVEQNRRLMMPEAQAHARAAEDLKALTKHATAARRHTVMNQLQAMRRIKNDIETSPNAAVAVRNLLEYSPGSGYKGESVRYIAEAYKSMINARLGELLEKTGLNLIGSNRNQTLLTDVFREAHGQPTGNKVAKSLADALQDTQRWLIQELNARGADIKILKNYGVPHSHDAGLMIRAGYEKWASTIETRLDWSRITDNETGRPFAEQAGIVPPREFTHRFLDDVYNGITTKGWDDRAPSMNMGGKALYNQRQEHRVLHFKSADAWLEYSRAFSDTDPFTAMMNGLNGMADDIAEMQVLGPNPKHGLNFAEQTLRAFAAEKKSPKLNAAIEYNVAVAHAMLAHQNGSASIPIRYGLAAFSSGVRSWLVSAHLGSAVTASVTDEATMIAAAQAVGMGAAKTLTRTVDLIASSATRESAARMGYIQSSIADATNGYIRFIGPQAVKGIGARLAGFTLRATGLSLVTDLRKVSFQMGFSAHLADNANLPFDQIEPLLRNVFVDRGITPADWDALRAPEGRFVTAEGADFISPFFWAKTQKSMPVEDATKLAIRMQAVMHEFLERAIPSMSLEGRALTRYGRPGSALGEVTASFSMYKSFGVSVMLNQFRTFMAQPTPLLGVALFAKVSAYLTLAGALALQLNQLGKGNDPRPMNDPKFWFAAYLQGGGLGIAGDFLFAETNRNGDGVAGVLAGPALNFGSDILGIGTRAAQNVLAGKDTTIGRDTINLARGNTPFLSSAFYLRTAYSRLVMDKLQSFVDPGAQVASNRQLRALQRDYGTQPYWPTKGSNQPLRLPNFSNALGASE